MSCSSFKFEYVVSRLLSELEQLSHTGRWSAAPPPRGYPEWPATVVVHDVDPRPQQYVTVRESAHGFEVSAYRYRTRLKSPAELELELPRLLAACAEKLGRLTADKLTAGREHVVREPFLDVMAGEKLRYLGQGREPRMDFERYAFARARGGDLELDTSRDEHASIIDDLHRFLDGP